MQLNWLQRPMENPFYFPPSSCFNFIGKYEFFFLLLIVTWLNLKFKIFFQFFWWFLNEIFYIRILKVWNFSASFITSFTRNGRRDVKQEVLLFFKFLDKYLESFWNELVVLRYESLITWVLKYWNIRVIEGSNPSYIIQCYYWQFFFKLGWPHFLYWNFVNPIFSSFLLLTVLKKSFNIGLYNRCFWGIFNEEFT